MQKFYARKTDEENTIRPSVAYHPEGYMEEYEAHDVRQQLICSQIELVEFESRSHFNETMKDLDSFNAFMENMEGNMIDDTIEDQYGGWL